MTDTLAGLSTSKQRLLERMLAGREAVRPGSGVIPRAQGSTVPLSPEQTSMWLHAVLVPHEPIYNEPITIRSAGRLDLALVERSLNIFAHRHELWRTAFRVVEGRVEQVVDQEANIKVLETTVSGESAFEREQEALRIAAADAREPFDLEQAPLVRARLISLSQSDQRLYLTLHHLLFDGISLTRVLLPELAAIYEACRADREPDLPRPRLQYGDYAAWRANGFSPSPGDSLSWWRQELSGELPVLDLDVARAKARRSQAGAMERFALSPSTVSRLKDLSHSEGVTLYAILLAAYAVLLHRHSGKSDILIGGVTDTRRRAELHGLFGCFLNTIVLRTRPNEDESFRRFVATVQETVLAALDHSDVSFDQIVREVRPNRAGLRHPVFQAMFSVQPPPAVVSGWDVAQMDVATGLSKFDLYLELEERSDSFLGRFLYATDLFDAPTVRNLVTEWLEILERALQQPDVTVGALVGSSIRALKSDPAINPPSIARAFETFPDWFEHQVRTNPNGVALEFEGQVATYQALSELADAFASHLRKLGIGPEKLVAVALERSFDLVVWLLAILKTGGAYLPVDPSQPRFRIASVIEDAKPDLILLNSGYAENLPDCSIPQLDCGSFVANAYGGDTAEEAPKTGPAARNLAYVIYTSGSTGKPKGVEITHQSLVNLLAAMKRRFALGPSDRALAINTLSFDFSVAEIFLPLVSGARLILAGREDARDPHKLKSLVERTQCTLLQGTPATWRGLIASGWSGRMDLTIVSGGEALAPDLAQRLLACGSSLWNVYGPTETTVFAIVHKVGAHEMSVPIGRPIDNVQAHVVREDGSLVAGAGQGELFIGGPGVARGYRNDPKLTGERFTAPSALGSERLYRTGDIVRRREDGTYEWLGRTDNQVKIRGFRVGLEEIETALQWHPDVVAAAVGAWPDASGGMSLCAYIVHVGDPDLVRFGLRVFLRERLPEHMVPSRFIALDRLPLTPSGKVDRKKLPEPKRNIAARRIDEPRDALERDLVQIWCSLLGLPQVGIHDNFFDLGGHSVLAFLMIAEVKRLAGGRELPLSAVLSNPTIAQLANVLKSDPAPFSHLAPLKREGRGNPLFIVHGAFGQILVFKRFADQIQTERPVYAVQAGGTDPNAAVERTIEEMSDTYLDAIRTVQPHGPYALAGYSFGGLIAYEMARKLHQAGETVEFLGLIDTYVHHQNLPPSEKLLYYLSLPLHLAQKLASLDPRQWPSYLRKRTEIFYRRATLRFRAPGDAGLSYDWSEVLPESSAQMYEVALREYLSYRLRSFEGTVSFFRASQRSLGECNPIPAWRAAVGRLEVHDVRGNHGTILEEDVAGLAQALSASLARVDAPRVPAPFVPIKDRKPRILVVTMMRWPSTVRLCMALKEAGFAIAAVAPDPHGLRTLKVCSEVFPCPIGNSPDALADAVLAWSPDLLIPADEFAVRYLHSLYWKCDGELAERLRPLIDRSQGAAFGHSITTSRAAFMALARREDIAVPETSTLAAMRKAGAEKSDGRIRAPLVLKLDGTSGGEGVRIVRSIAEIDEAACRLVHPPWLEIAKDILLTRSIWPLRERMHRAEKEVVVQKFIPGACANRAVVCWNGEVLAGISAEAVETVSSTGPSSVVRLIENREMAEIAARLVKRLGLSGFCGFDFVLEERTGKPVLIELNPRPTPSCHLAFDRTTDMVGALFAQMSGSAARAPEAEEIPDAIAYFPQEMWRDPSSKHLKKAYHDVPWEEPDFVEMYFRPHAGDWPVQLALKLRRLWPTAIAGKLFSNFTVAKDR